MRLYTGLSTIQFTIEGKEKDKVNEEEKTMVDEFT